MVQIAQLILDGLLFKLAFHTYEVLSNKQKILKRQKTQEENEIDGGANRDDGTELDLISNMSDESTMTLGGPASARDKKIERYDENLDVKLNRYLMKWIVVIIFYQVQFVFSIAGWILPAMPALKVLLAFWIMLPQFKGEFFMYHLIEDYIQKCEHFILEIRSKICSSIVRFFTLLQLGSLKLCVTYISEECVVKT